jgi:protein-tyrosine phosphatase
MRFHRHPVPDRGVPPQPAFDAFIDGLVPRLQEGAFLAIHCRAGIGRSSIVAAALLLRLGLTPDQALTLISIARGFDVPDTYDQLDFIYSLRQG